MPRLPARPCAHRGCPNLVRGRDRRFCPEHQSEEWKRQDAQRGTAAERGYDFRWREIRDQFLADHPLCAQCGNAPATVAHHVVRKRDGGSDDPSNLLALCASCHSALHAESGESWSR